MSTTKNTYQVTLPNGLVYTETTKRTLAAFLQVAVPQDEFIAWNLAQAEGNEDNAYGQGLLAEVKWEQEHPSADNTTYAVFSSHATRAAAMKARDSKGRYSAKGILAHYSRVSTEIIDL